ncbi:MAG: glycosyltransferase family 2 protein [Candidatus Edwardsbacteria bacterium]
MNNTKLSVVIPVYNEGESIPELCDRLQKILTSLNLNYEVIFVDDGSTDKTFSLLKERHNQHNKIKILHFNKNFGKAYAYSAGFASAKGEIIITMDGDLQDAPEEIPNFLEKMKEGYDLVSGWKYTGKGKRRFSSKFFNFVTSFFTKLPLHDFNCPFKAYRQEVAKNLHIYGELHRFIPALAYWKGYKITEIKVENYPRKYGKTKYGFGRFIKGFLDLITVIFLTQYIKRPLHFFGLFGLIFGVGGFCIDLAITVEGLAKGKIGHQALLLLGLFLIVIGIQFVFTGLLGEMIYSLRETKEEEHIVKQIVE